MSIVSSRYSEALFDLAIEEEKVDEFYETLLSIKEVFLTNDDFNEVLMHPEITLQEKVSLIKSVFNEIEKTIINFLLVIIEKNRAKDIVAIIDDFEVFYNEYRNIENAVVYSVVKLKKAQITKLEKQLSNKFSKTVRVTNIIDESIVGGIRVVINNTVIDTSVKTRIKDLGEAIHKVQLK